MIGIEEENWIKPAFLRFSSVRGWAALFAVKLCFTGEP